MVGVTTTISSITEWFRLLERNSCPRIGTSAIPGILLSVSVVRRSRIPEMPKV